MATLVLTAVGTIVGGPIGGAIGSMIGQMVDRQIFAPPGVKGPRLGDLSVQTSSYGSAIPRIYGRMRVAGTVIWATDLVEHSSSSGGGKSGPEVTTYSYTASFAVALSSRRALSVKRIWADGKLLKGPRGDFKHRMKLRFYPGSESQPVDPLIASVEGSGRAPAHRGLSYVVFQDLDLTSFGNRIPQISFEIEAESAAVPVGEMLADLSGGLIQVSEETPALSGFAALGSTRRAAVANLVELFGIPMIERADRVMAGSVEHGASLPPRERRGCHFDSKSKVEREVRRIDSANDVPSAISIGYYDAERDYQAGVARAAIEGGGRGEVQEDSAAVLGASAAKQLAYQVMAARWAGREQWSVSLSAQWLGLATGETVTLPEDDGQWTVREVTAEGLTVRANLRRIAPPMAAMIAEPGRAVPPPDRKGGRNKLRLVDLPALDGGVAENPSVWIAASSEGFRSVPVKGWRNGVEVADTVIRQAATLGVVEGVLRADVPSMLRDERSVIDVQLADPDAWLSGADDDALGAGANLAQVADELIQFGRVEALGGGRFRLSSILRGRLGSEWAMATHDAGEEFLLIDGQRLVSLSLDRSAVGAVLEAQSFGLEDDPLDPPSDELTVTGEAMRPLAPALCEAKLLSSGELRLRWRRRSRRYAAWLDGVDCAPPSATIEVRVADGMFVGEVIDADEVTVPASVADALPPSFEVTITAIMESGRSRPWRQEVEI